MKRLALGLLSSLALMMPISPTLAAEGFQPNPFQLVNLAYEGHFKDQGIPGHRILEEDYTSGEIDARDVVAAAVEAGDLPASKLEESQYINAVRLQMRSLQIDNNSNRYPR